MQKGTNKLSSLLEKCDFKKNVFKDFIVLSARSEGMQQTKKFSYFKYSFSLYFCYVLSKRIMHSQYEVQNCLMTSSKLLAGDFRQTLPEVSKVRTNEVKAIEWLWTILSILTSQNLPASVTNEKKKSFKKLDISIKPSTQ